MELTQHLESLTEDNVFKRIGAVEALVKAGPDAVGPLSYMALDQNLPNHARACAVKALGGIGGADAAETLILALGDPEVVVKIPAAMALGNMKEPKAAGPLAALLGDASTLVRKYAAEAICAIAGSCASTENLLSLKGAVLQSMPSSKAATEAASAIFSKINAKSDSLMGSDAKGLGGLHKAPAGGNGGPKLNKIH